LKATKVVLSALMMSFSFACMGQAPAGQPAQKLGESSTYREPYDFRGIRLGFTVSEFKAAPLLDQDWQDRRAPEFVKCGPDADSRDNAQLGVVKCEWMADQKKYYGSAALQTGGTYVLRSHSLYFIAKPGDPEPRLFRMLFDTNALAYEEIVGSLTAKFGKPRVVDPSIVQNRMGASFNSESRMWSNSVSSVTAFERSERIDSMALLYELEDYAKFFDEAQAKQRANTPSKL
jgi:hypothetical protein